MTPIEKAQEYYEMMYSHTQFIFHPNIRNVIAKNCCYTMIDELIKETNEQLKDYWQEVKNQIQKL
jgi:hypothetical protein